MYIERNRTQLLWKVKRNMVVHAENFDRCMMIARNLRDSNICTDSYINSLETNTKPYVLSILKDY